MARRATHLTWPKPSLCLFVLLFCFLFPFLSLLLIEKPVFPPRRAFLFIFECLPLFLLSLFWPPPFSVSLSPSLFCSFLSFFLLVFLFCLLLVPCFCLFVLLSSLLLFHERNNIKRFNCKAFFINPFSCFGFLSCFSLRSLFLIFAFFPDFQLCFCSTSMLLVSKTQAEKHQFWVKRGVATKRFL